jgi:hypothetical protein
MGDADREKVRSVLHETFAFLFRQLRVTDTQEMVKRIVALPQISRSGPSALRMKAAADDWDLSD